MEELGEGVITGKIRNEKRRTKKDSHSSFTPATNSCNFLASATFLLPKLMKKSTKNNNKKIPKTGHSIHFPPMAITLLANDTLSSGPIVQILINVRPLKSIKDKQNNEKGSSIHGIIDLLNINSQLYIRITYLPHVIVQKQYRELTDNPIEQ